LPIGSAIAKTPCSIPWTKEDKGIFRQEYKNICTFFSTSRSAEMRGYEAVILNYIKMKQARINIRKRELHNAVSEFSIPLIEVRK
jgi:hypothetical protein